MSFIPRFRQIEVMNTVEIEKKQFDSTRPTRLDVSHILAGGFAPVPQSDRQTETELDKKPHQEYRSAILLVMIIFR